jgi:dTMP kinase
MSSDEHSTSAERPPNHGLLVVFEGIDGAGKSLQSRLLWETLETNGMGALLTAEPTNGPIGLRLRAASVRPSPEIEERLFREDRKEHVSQVILPALRRGLHVICDRYFFSSAAYQGARGMDPRAILLWNREFAPEPDLVFILEIDPEAACERIARARDHVDEAYENLEYLKRVAEIYAGFREPNIVRIQYGLDTQAVHELVKRHFRDLLNRY